jgi:hypothetical protein
VATAPGICSPVSGRPHGDRPQCAAASGDDPCTARVCQGEADRTQCTGFAGVEVICREGACQDGVEASVGHCDGSGVCPEPQTGRCAPYVCQGSACGGPPCGGDTDCADEFKCDVASGRCVPRDVASCDGDHTVTAPDGVATTDCSPYLCEVGANGGQCMDHCAATTDCVTGYVCDTLQGQGVCVATNPDPGNQGGGCAVAPTSGTRAALGVGLGLLLLAIRRRWRG